DRQRFRGVGPGLQGEGRQGGVSDVVDAHGGAEAGVRLAGPAAADDVLHPDGVVGGDRQGARGGQRRAGGGEGLGGGRGVRGAQGEVRDVVEAQRAGEAAVLVARPGQRPDLEVVVVAGRLARRQGDAVALDRGRAGDEGLVGQVRDVDPQGGGDRRAVVGDGG